MLWFQRPRIHCPLSFLSWLFAACGTRNCSCYCLLVFTLLLKSPTTYSVLLYFTVSIYSGNSSKNSFFFSFLFCLSEYHCTSHTIECMFQFRHHFGSVVFILCLSSYWFQRYGELWIYRFARNIILSILNKKIERLSLITMVFYHSFDDHHEKWYWSTLI